MHSQSGCPAWKTKLAGSQAPPVLPLLVPTPNKGKSLDISRKMNDIKEPLYKLKRAWEKSSQFFLGSPGDLVQLLPQQTPSISPFLNFPLFLLSLCIVLSRSFDVRQLANSKLRRLPPLTFDWRSNRSSEFLLNEVFCRYHLFQPQSGIYELRTG